MDAESISIPKLGYSLAEFEVATGLSRATLYRLIAAEELSTIKVRGRRLVPTWQARQFLDVREKQQPMTLDPSLYIDLTPAERFRLTIASVHRNDTEELALLGRNPDPPYLERWRTLNELTSAIELQVCAVQLRYDESAAPKMPRLRAIAKAWGQFCSELGVSQAHTATPFLRRALAADGSAYSECDSGTCAEILEALRTYWRGRVDLVDAQETAAASKAALAATEAEIARGIAFGIWGATNSTEALPQK